MSPCHLTATELARKLKERELTAAEVLESQLSQIERHNGAVNAVVSLDVEGARRQARAADAAIAKGEPVGPLHGVPITLKDGIDVAGLRTTLGAPEADRVAREDATVAARLRAAGAIVIGHTNVAPWLGDPLQTANPIFGRTHNPWDVARTPGGSSGGAAAAVAALMTPLEITSDLAGSTRIPAHFCGIYGLKPTEHRVPLTGFFRPPPGVPQSVRIMSVLGPMARSIDDLQLALELVSGPDGLEGDVPPVPLVRSERVELKGLRLAFTTELPGASVARGVREQVERVAEGARRAGAHVEERLPDIDWGAQFGLFGELVGSITSVFNPDGSESEGARSLGWYLRALDLRDRFAFAWHSFFDSFDALLLPPAATTAFTHRDPGTPVEVEGRAVSYWELGLASPLANLVGIPALVAPAGRDEEGLPVGVQIMGKRWSEMRLLDIARALEREGVLPGFEAPPGF